MTWAQRLKRVFNIDVSTCPQCGGEARVIACIEDQAVIDKILGHLMNKECVAFTAQSASCHAGFAPNGLVCIMV